MGPSEYKQKIGTVSSGRRVAIWSGLPARLALSPNITKTSHPGFFPSVSSDVKPQDPWEEGAAGHVGGRIAGPSPAIGFDGQNPIARLCFFAVFLHKVCP